MDVRDLVEGLKDARGPCPDAGALVEYGALGPAVQADHPAHAHVQICSRCQLVLLGSDEGQTGVRPGSDRGRTPWWAFPAAATLLVAMAIPLLYRSPAPPATDAVRGTDLQAIAPLGATATVREFRWQSPIRAARYRVSVYRDGVSVWSQTADGATPSIAAPAILIPGVAYTWQVEALDAAGDVRAASAREVFTIQR